VAHASNSEPFPAIIAPLPSASKGVSNDLMTLISDAVRDDRWRPIWINRADSQLPIIFVVDAPRESSQDQAWSSEAASCLIVRPFGTWDQARPSQAAERDRRVSRSRRRCREHLWAKVAATETVILNTQAQSVGDVIAKLKVALLHSGADGWVDDALLSNDDATLFAGQTNWTCPIDW